PRADEGGPASVGELVPRVDPGPPESFLRAVPHSVDVDEGLPDHPRCPSRKPSPYPLGREGRTREKAEIATPPWAARVRVPRPRRARPAPYARDPPRPGDDCRPPAGGAREPRDRVSRGSRA